MKLDRFRTPSEAPLFSLTAMIDVLFLMIICLVMGANFDPVASVTLPESSGGPLAEGTLRIELRADGVLLLAGRPLALQETLELLRRRNPRSVLLLPDRKLDVGSLFRLYDQLGRELDVPISVGVLPPTPSTQ